VPHRSHDKCIAASSEQQVLVKIRKVKTYSNDVVTRTSSCITSTTGASDMLGESGEVVSESKPYWKMSILAQPLGIPYAQHLDISQAAKNFLKAGSDPLSNASVTL
jgi:hypothetical protein